MFRFDPNSSYVMPAHFGPRPMNAKASGWYHDVTAMTVSYVTDRGQLARYLPEPFEVGEQARVSVFYACNRQVDWLAGHGYNMIAVNASAVFNGNNDHKTGEFTLVMWENLTDPILSGRELQGIPKIYADIPDHSVIAGEWQATASHFGHTIVDLAVSDLRQATADEIEAGLEDQATSTPMGWRYLPGVSGLGETTSEPTAYPSENHFTSVQVGDGRIDWHQLTWEQNPTQFHIVNALAELPVLEYGPAVITEGSTNLILFDDLPQGVVVTIDEISRVLYIGAGTMGCANSLVAAVSGYDVVLHDASVENLDAVADRHQEIATFLVGSGYCTDDDIVAARSRIDLEADLAEAVAEVDLVSESIFEDLEAKRSVLGQLDQLVQPSTILTTNTSALLVSDIEDAVERGDRFAALHSHLGSLLVDIVGGPRTSPETIDTLRRYVLSLGAVPLVLNKENPGYVFNALNGPLLATALNLVVNDRATKETVDRAWMTERGAPMGPFGMIDLFGIDVVVGAWRRPNDDPAREALRAKVAPLLEQFVAEGNLGMKTGRGFYQYPGPAYQTPSFLTDAGVDRPTADALTATLVGGALSLAAKEVASPADIDMAWMAATSLDIGPFGLLDQLGPDRFVAMLDQQVASELMTADAAATARTHVEHRPT